MEIKRTLGRSLLIAAFGVACLAMRPAAATADQLISIANFEIGQDERVSSFEIDIEGGLLKSVCHIPEWWSIYAANKVHAGIGIEGWTYYQEDEIFGPAAGDLKNFLIASLADDSKGVLVTGTVKLVRRDVENNINHYREIKIVPNMVSLTEVTSCP